QAAGGALRVLGHDGGSPADVPVVDALGAPQIIVAEGDGILFAVDDRVEASEQAPAAALIGVLFALAEGVLGGGGSDRLGEAAEGVYTLIVDPLGDTSSVRNGHLAAELVVGECSYLAARVLALDELVEAVWCCSPVVERRAKASRPRFAAGARVTPGACSRAPPPS